MMKKIKLKRVYDPIEKTDGYRILIDRLWPRGIKKENAGVDLWLKEIAPSPTLRKWFNHEPNNWVEFQKRYAKELENKKELINAILDKTRVSNVTLLYAAKDETYNHAAALYKIICK